ncbi:MAG TPA: 16S rRNA (uracil(1498)-N(3))-methyltransferase [Myxococcales bacterium]|nr:16S rRNA (uracil(1498)-N(3))-methyltransferase [Myxococcales bacterium]
MNLLLLTATDLCPDGTARLAGRRVLHAREVLRAAEGDVLRVGVLGGKVGRAEIVRLSADELVLRVELTGDPPPRAEIDLLLAVPRPKALRRILPSLASLGIDRVVLLNSARVERSYFDSKVFAQAPELFALGLEQARDTRPPELLVRERFRPFVEDELDGLFPASARLVAHPAAPPLERRSLPGRVLLAVGPEGGWVPFELELLRQHGFAPFTLGPRPLRVETALPYALGALSRSRTSP